MKLKKWLILVAVLTLTLSVVGTVTAFTLTNDGEDDSSDSTNLGGEVDQGIPTYEEWFSKYGSTQGPVTSIDDIDPNECNLLHNINACSPEEIEALSGGSLTDGEAASIGMCAPDVPDCIDYLVVPQGEEVELEYDSEAGGNPEPLFVDVKPAYIVQPFDEAVREDCSLAGGTVYVTVEGELGCEDPHDSEDNGDELVTSSQPPAVEPEPVPATQ